MLKKIFMLLIFFAIISRVLAQDPGEIILWGLNDFLPNYGYEPQDQSARTFGMAGISIANAKGAEAAFSNPAALAMDSKNPEIYLDARTNIFGKPKQMNEDDLQDLDIDDYSRNYSLYYCLSHLSACVPYRKPNSPVSYAGGLAFYRHYDWGTKANEKLSTSYYDREIKLGIGGMLNILSFSGAVNYEDKISGGISLGFPMMSSFGGSMDYEDSYGYDLEGKADYEVSGSLFKIGILGKFSKISAGFVYTGAMEIEGKDGEVSGEENGVDYEEDLDNWKLKIPGLVAVGATFSPTEMITLGLEYQTRPWEDYTLRISGVGSEDIGDENGYSLRFGGELNLEKVALRAGYIMDKTNLEDRDNDPVTFGTITGGLGIKLTNLAFDFGAGYTMGKFEGLALVDYILVETDISYSLLYARFGATYTLPQLFK